jgi:2-hydroxychromene-2-carboxylate isomerase
MSAPVDFYFDFASPYAYFLAEPLQALCERRGRRLRWRPILLWTVLKQLGLPAPMENPAKQRYMLHDMARSARHYGRPFSLPSRFPLSSHLPARAFHYLQGQDETLAQRFAAEIFSAYFTRDADLGAPDVVAAIGVGLGLDRGVMEQAMNADAAKDALRAAGAEAAARGVWGSPFVFVGDEAFFGADRLPQIAAVLAATENQ